MSLRCKADRVRDALQGATGTLAYAPDYILATGKGLAEGLADACKDGGHCSTVAGYFFGVEGRPFAGTIQEFFGDPFVRPAALLPPPLTAGRPGI